MCAARFVQKGKIVFQINNFLKFSNKTLIRNLSSANVAIQKDYDFEKLSWKLCASTCLIRLPLVERTKTELEKKFFDYMSSVEFEKSVLCDWEVNKNHQNEQIRLVKAGNLDASKLEFKFSNQELEDSFQTSLAKFKDSLDFQEPDNSDFKNVNRKPEDTLVLITKQKLGKDYVWMLPTKPWDEGETLRETAENALHHCIDCNNSPKFVSNSPASFYKYKLPKIARPEASCVGVKLFIYSAFIPRNTYTKSTVNFDMMESFIKDDNSGFAWVTLNELKSFMKPKYVKIIQNIVL